MNNAYEKLEAIHSMMLDYLDCEDSCRDVLWEVLGIVEEVRETYLKNANSDALESIEKTFNTILQVMHDPERYVLLSAQIKFLADQIRDYQGDSDDLWCIGEGGEFTISDFIPAAYWHFSHWHGQPSWEYQTLSALGAIFSPGMTSEPEPDEPEHYPFQVLGETAASFWGHVN